MKILLINTAFIGDIILQTALIKAIKQLYPNCVLDVVVIPQSAGVLNHNPNVNKVILFDKRKNKLKAFFKTVFKLRKEKYDIAFLPHSSATTLQLAFFAGIKQRIGYAKNKGSFLLTNKVEFKKSGHRIYKNLDLLKPLTNKTFEASTEMFFNQTDEEKALSFLTNQNKGNVVAISPGSVWATKRWGENNYKQLVDLLVDEGFTVVLTGSQGEHNLCQSVMAEKNCINTAGELSLTQTAALVKNCSLMICNDSGALHIANAMQTPVFAFFGPTVKKFGYYPYRPYDKLFEVKLDCRPCGKHGGKSCPLGTHACMQKIKPQFVFAAVKKFFTTYK